MEEKNNQEHHKKRKDLSSNLEKFYKNLNIHLIVSLVFFVIILGIVGVRYVSTGDIFLKDVSLSGGTSISAYLPVSSSGIEEHMVNNYKRSDYTIKRITSFPSNEEIGFIIESNTLDEDKIINIINQVYNLNLSKGDQRLSVESTSDSLGSSFYKQMMVALIIAFVLICVVVFIAFRNFIPSIAVILSLTLDMFAVIAFLGLFEIRLSIAGVASILMLIGYSVDTDILLTTKLLKRQEDGSMYERLGSSIKTGLSMTLTAVVALLAAYFLSGAEIVKQISMILVVGLIVDIFATYIMNASILLWYLRKKEFKK